jgi:hypothetical protein
VPDFLVASIVLSVVLTIVVNAVLWLFPGSGRRVDDGVQRLAERQAGSFDARYDRPQRSRVQVIFPWKAMLIGSIVLTVVLNLAIVLFD